MMEFRRVNVRVKRAMSSGKSTFTGLHRYSSICSVPAEMSIWLKIMKRSDLHQYFEKYCFYLHTIKYFTYPNNIPSTIRHKSMDTFKVASGDTYSANAKNCAQFFTPSPQKLRLSEFSAGHASQEVT